jgi:hypothetical protein
MIAANTIPALEVSIRRIPAPRRVRSSPADYVASLKAELGITEHQLRAWGEFCGGPFGKQPQNARDR